MITYPVLTVTTFLPLVGAAAILLFGDRLARWMALATTLATLAVSAPLYLFFDKTSSALQFVEVADWIPSWNIRYGMGVDGISLPFIFLSAVLSVLCVGASWTALRTRVRDFYAALLVTETAMIGLFAVTNFFLFYVFWELMIVPMFLLIGVWGGPRRTYAAVTTTFPGSWCWSSTEYSLASGHSRSGLNRLVVPRLNPVDGPSSLTCGMRSPLVSRHERVSLVTTSGLIRVMRLTPWGV